MPIETLSPAQENAYTGILHMLTMGNLVVLSGDAGSGMSTVMRALHAELGGAFLTISDFIEALRGGKHPLAMEEALTQVLYGALAKHDIVLMDDLNLVEMSTTYAGSYPRGNLLDAALTAFCALVVQLGKKVVFACQGSPPTPLNKRAFIARIGEYKIDDYRYFCTHHLAGSYAHDLDYVKIHRFAPYLNSYQLISTCAWLNQGPALDTERFIEYLLENQLASNVDLDEVQAVDLHDLKGIDHVIESLEGTIILPFENDELAIQLDLKPRRGVLLAGPPGTGKTTVGRALAHRLRSKFFLIDGRFIAGTGTFYQRVDEVFTAAKRNAPAIIFIDDSDAIFENQEEPGLYRYLLTMLDGLESESIGRVCVIMTAMNVGDLPAALVRSGRIELWLEMRLPDVAARAEILRNLLVNLPRPFDKVEIALVAQAAEGFTGADLKRVVEDGKTFYAFDLIRKQPIIPITQYFLKAIAAINLNKKRYAEASGGAMIIEEEEADKMMHADE